MSFEFKPCQPSVWEGRYSRIPGDISVFHIEYVNGRWWPTIKWEQDCGRGTCVALDSAAVKQLAQSVNVAKIAMGGSGGGSFVITEFGKVIVPASKGGLRMLVGGIAGKLLFADPFKDDEVIDLSDHTGMQCGEVFVLPYVGMPFNLSKRSQIYFYKIDSDGGDSVFPPTQDQELIAALRRVRRSGPVKFIVNPYGIVATKKPMNTDWEKEEKWTPVYVGKVNFNHWFAQE